ncbi:MAG: 3-deoxy-D-manno-octulosonic acid transferase [Bacteroidia bacterium]|nr:3-deoxy-D-manno-octulosonic acid transferase [Bacteroidia bacterium]
MAVFFYNIFLFLFKAGIHLFSPFNAKAKQWVRGRQEILERLQKAIPENEKIIWMHCASLGEFEQGRPLLEKMKFFYPDFKFLLTFFSPSGFESKKKYDGVDWIFYLPLDGPLNAKKFLEIVHPVLVIFVKYEFWYYYLKKIKYRNIPLLLISALFRNDMSFFKWYGGLQRKMLSRFNHLFVQNSTSKNLIDKIGLADICSISGDTRFDRVIEIAENFEPIDSIEHFIGEDKVIVAGSTWPEDEQILQKAFTLLNDSLLKLIIAPHEINEKHLKEIKELFPDSVLYSQLTSYRLSAGQTVLQQTDHKVLIIDNIGMLSRLYKYGYLTYVGGGFRKMGVHNVLEAAVYNKIVLFGPYYQKYNEAVDLVISGGGLSFNDYKKDGRMLKDLIEALLIDESEYNYRSKAAGDFTQSNKGATEKILHFIQEKRLLTN